MSVEDPKSEIGEWYDGRSVLVTGATGFMGKVLVEKLLRSCPKLRKIYILVRTKKGIPPRQRLHKEILDAELFDTIKRNNPEYLDKIVPIGGDILSVELGLSEEDKNILIENVTVVFHSAATVKFDEALKLSIAMNIVGTGVLLKLCEKMKKLDAFIHVSTAYCNCHLDEIDEKIYPPPADLENLLNYVDKYDDDVVDAMTSEIISNRPNTYTFTKALAEQILVDYSASIPIAIVRPSIVTASWKEPMPGWVDNLNGPTGMFVGAGKGVVRSIFCHKNMIADLIPVDVAISLMICVAWYTGTNRSKGIQIYNCTSGTTNPLLWGEIEEVGKKAVVEQPFSGVLWYPGGSFKSSKYLNSLCCFTFHTVPAYLVDFIALLIGKKRIMIRVKKKLSKAMATLEYFTTKEWRFLSNNMYKLWDDISEEDRTTFNFDIRNLNWKDYIMNYHLGTRRYILKENDDTLPSAKLHLDRMRILHYSVQMLFLFMVYVVFVRGTSIDVFCIDNIENFFTYIHLLFN